MSGAECASADQIAQTVAAGRFFAAGRGTQPRAAALENSFSAPQFLQVPTVVVPPGAGNIQ